MSYTHAVGVSGIDEPIEIHKGSETVIPHTGWREMLAMGTYPDGTPSDCAVANPCTRIDWPAMNVTTDGAGYNRAEPSTWYGSIASTGTEGSGLQYMRNRYYDPKRGQFTQADPIGLGGGLNLYGFAGGDAINFSDPFGLCPPNDNNKADCAKPKRTIPQKVGDFAAGFGDFVTFRVTKKARELVGCGRCVDYNSGLYKAGEVAAGVAVAAESGLAVARGIGWTSRIAIHEAHHSFPVIGKAVHVQVNVWKVGVKGSGWVFRIPLPWR